MEVMKKIPEKSIDMILCDLPYEVLDLEWDKRIDGDSLFAEYKRICKQNANVLLFCQIEFAHYLMNAALDSEFSHCLIWQKNNLTRYKSKNYLPASKYEMILVFRLNKYANKNAHSELRKYFMSELEKSGKSIKEIETEIPNKSAHHWFRYSSDFRIPTADNYKRLQEITNCFKRQYQDIEQEFLTEKKNKCTFNAGFISSDILTGALKEKRVHPTQKPVELLKTLIKAYSNPNETVLDNCMGSGSTGVASIETKRKFIGIELSENYFEIAKQRIKNTINEQNQLSFIK